MTTGPMKDSIESLLALSRQFLDDSVANFDEGRLRTAADRVYYTIHHAAVALLIDRGIKPPKSHRGLIVLFGREIVLPGIMDSSFGEMLTKTLDLRGRSTYAPGPEPTIEEVSVLLADAEEFLKNTRTVLKKD
jgi:uncharacterized protein (UPF0332 family)